MSASPVFIAWISEICQKHNKHFRDPLNVILYTDNGFANCNIRCYVFLSDKSMLVPCDIVPGVLL